jgi:hypothetical protein
MGDGGDPFTAGIAYGDGRPGPAVVVGRPHRRRRDTADGTVDVEGERERLAGRGSSPAIEVTVDRCRDDRQVSDPRRRQRALERPGPGHLRYVARPRHLPGGMHDRGVGCRPRHPFDVEGERVIRLRDNYTVALHDDIALQRVRVRGDQATAGGVERPEPADHGADLPELPGALWRERSGAQLDLVLLPGLVLDRTTGLLVGGLTGRHSG